MQITYDPEADAAYFHICEKTEPPDTRQFDEDLFLDFDEANRLVGVEVLAASRRLDINQLLPFVEIIGREEPGWRKLVVKLLNHKQECQPILTKIQKKKNWVEEVGIGHVKIKRDTTGNTVTITRQDLENKDTEWHRTKRRRAIVEKLWKIGSYKAG
jgi:uncharacterized protein YuzE